MAVRHGPPKVHLGHGTRDLVTQGTSDHGARASKGRRRREAGLRGRHKKLDQLGHQQLHGQLASPAPSGQTRSGSAEPGHRQERSGDDRRRSDGGERRRDRQPGSRGDHLQPDHLLQRPSRAASSMRRRRRLAASHPTVPCPNRDPVPLPTPHPPGPQAHGAHRQPQNRAEPDPGLVRGDRSNRRSRRHHTAALSDRADRTARAVIAGATLVRLSKISQ